MITLLGFNIDRENSINREWLLYTPELLKNQDPDLTALLTNPIYHFPTVAPDGTYEPKPT
jgi:hypothetical protein